MHNKKQEFAEKLEIEYEKKKINFMQRISLPLALAAGFC